MAYTKPSKDFTEFSIIFQSCLKVAAESQPTGYNAEDLIAYAVQLAEAVIEFADDKSANTLLATQVDAAPLTPKAKIYAKRAAKKPAPEQEEAEFDPDNPECPDCGGDMWDNSGPNKKFPKSPDFKCKDKDGCGKGVWID